MSLEIKNGHATGFRKKLTAPSPAEIAERAWDRAARVAVTWLKNGDGDTGDSLRDVLDASKKEQLSALRDEVINPTAIPKGLK